MLTYRLVPLLFLYQVVVLCQTGEFAARQARYRLQPSDVLELHYRYTPEFDQTVTLQPDGFVTLQIVGDIKLQGLSLEEAKTIIVNKAGLRLNTPELTLVLKDFEKPYFVVVGEVGNPGRFEMRGTINPIQAIAIAGGFKTASAKHSQVILLRREGSDLAKTQILDLKAAMSATFSEQASDLRSGDVLVVPQNRISRIERFLKWGSIAIFLSQF